MKGIRYNLEVPVDAETAYGAWTTEEGIRSFFSPDFVLDPRCGGHYEIYFDPEAPKGQRGGEGCRIIAMDEPALFGFTWNFPPTMPELRDDGQHSVCWVEFLPHRRKESTRVRFTNTGYGEGVHWNYGLDYFERAWGDIVLARYRYSFEHGPVDWSVRPDYSSYVVKGKRFVMPD